MTASDESKPIIDDLNAVFKILNFSPTSEQRRAIENVDGPQLIIAGPGSGKTEVLILRTLYLLLVKRVDPSKILVCTFTEKAALSLQDRLRGAARKLGISDKVDLTELWIGTIHSICEEIINENLDETYLTKGYVILDELTQQLFLYEHYYETIERPEPLSKYRWPSIREGIKYFSKITEDIVDIERMAKSGNEKLESIARKYKRYEDCLRENNAIDFSHLQSEVLSLIENTAAGESLKGKFDYIMVDEYQDTNYIQERLFLELAKGKENICVVGDEDQSLYRFRGAVVDNFLRFPDHFENVSVVKLEENFRSTPQIVKFANDFVGDSDWKDSTGRSYRYDKTIRERRKPYDNGMRSVYRIYERSPKRIAKIIGQLIERKVVSDANQIAVLMKSVANDGSEIMEALNEGNIKYYATRSRNFFNLTEVQAIIGMLLSVTQFDLAEVEWNDDLAEYYVKCKETFTEVSSAQMKNFVAKTSRELKALSGSLKKGILDIFYESLGNEPFLSWTDDPIYARNMSIFSDLLSKFQEYYRLMVIHEGNLEAHGRRLFNSFLYSMKDLGLDEYEDPNDVFPPGYLQIMTIHQAKGLEFPVVIVYGLNKKPRSDSKLDKELEPYSHRKHYEPYELIGDFDFRRLFYVAFSRPMDLLILATDMPPNPRLRPAFLRAYELDDSETDRIMDLKFRVKEFLPPKPEFSITGDIHAYDICPRQYKYYGEYGFSGSRSSGETFGTLVHYTIEDIHLHFLKNKPGALDETRIRAYFEKNYKSVKRGGAHPLAEQFLEMAFKQVMDYFKNNKALFGKLIRAEEPILVDRPKYVMSGVIDLIRGENGELELLDFKAQTRDKLTPDRERFYKFQLAIYAKMIERKLGIKPKRTFIYLTAEPNTSNALVEIKIQDTESKGAEEAFDDYATKIMSKDFKVKNKPPRDVCRNCDFRYGCRDRIKFYPSMSEPPD